MGVVFFLIRTRVEYGKRTAAVRSGGGTGAGSGGGARERPRNFSLFSCGAPGDRHYASALISITRGVPRALSRGQQFILPGTREIPPPTIEYPGITRTHVHEHTRVPRTRVSIRRLYHPPPTSNTDNTHVAYAHAHTHTHPCPTTNQGEPGIY